MKIVGLYIVAFGVVGLSTLLGFSEPASLFGAILGTGTYILHSQSC